MSAHTLKMARKPIALAVLGLLVLQTATAQTAAADATTPAATPDTKLESVVVSGSRIKRDTFSSPAPITVIRSEEAALSGLGSTAEMLLSVGVTGGQGQINNAFGGYVTDGGPGANTVGLRGFSPTRTLILLNGRRMSPSGTRGSVGAADLNTLPNSIVDRVEVLKDGASSIYGSDAVAGVINIITKRDLNEIRLDASTSISEHGGGNKYNFSIAGGQVKDHSRFLVSYNFHDEQELTLGQRDWTRCNTSYQRVDGGDWGSKDYVDPLTGKPKCYPTGVTGENGVTINTIGTGGGPLAGGLYTGVGAAGSVGTGFNRWRPNSAITSGLVGYEGVGGGANNINVRDTFDPRTLNSSLLSPVRNHNLYAQGGVDIDALGDAEAYWELLYNRRESSQVGYRQLSLDYAKGSPLIPSNLAWSTVQSAPTVITNGQALGVRAFIGAGNSYSSQDVDFVRAVGGLRGTIANTGWDYDVSLQHSESRGSYTYDGFLADRLAQSLNVVASGSGYNCVDPSNGCVAAPALSSAVIGGKLPQAWMNYVFSNSINGVTKYKEDIVSASATGKLFKLPYGDVKGAVGAEFRSDKIDDTPSVDQQTGNIYNFTSSTPTRGKDHATDFFGEVEAPLLKNLPMVRELTVNASARVSDYKSYGSGTTHKYGINYKPTEWLSLRGTNGTSYRAPALFEQFVGATTGFLSNAGDPCNDYQNSTNANVRANCAAQGLPGDFQQKNSITSITNGGRDAGLKAETSKNSSWGFILQPTLPAGMGEFSFAVDRFDIKVDNGVNQAGTANILSMCYDSVGLSSPFCRLITRDGGSTALSVNNSYVNLATDIVRGYDINLSYENKIGIGKLSVVFEATRYTQQANKLFADDPLYNFNNDIGSPKWAGDLNVDYKFNGWNLHYGMEFVGKTSSYADVNIQEDPATSQYKFDTPAYYLHSMSVSYNDTVSKWKVTGGVRNLADKKPPQISSGYYNRVGNAPLYSGYDFVGRTFFMNVSKSF